MCFFLGKLVYATSRMHPLTEGLMSTLWTLNFTNGKYFSLPYVHTYTHRYEAPLYVDVKYRELQRDRGAPDFSEVSSQTYNQVHLGHVPIMLRSDFCSLAEASETALQEVGECPYDQVRGYRPFDGW